jgi:hypothetical protein
VLESNAAGLSKDNKAVPKVNSSTNCPNYDPCTAIHNAHFFDLSVINAAVSGHLSARCEPKVRVAISHHEPRRCCG